MAQASGRIVLSERTPSPWRGCSRQGKMAGGGGGTNLGSPHLSARSTWSQGKGLSERLLSTEAALHHSRPLNQTPARELCLPLPAFPGSLLPLECPSAPLSCAGLGPCLRVDCLPHLSSALQLGQRWESRKPVWESCACVLPCLVKFPKRQVALALPGPWAACPCPTGHQNPCISLALHPLACALVQQCL